MHSYTRDHVLSPPDVQLYVCDFGAKTYNRDALDKQCPVQQGEEHVLNLEEVRALGTLNRMQRWHSHCPPVYRRSRTSRLSPSY